MAAASMGACAVLAVGCHHHTHTCYYMCCCSAPPAALRPLHHYPFSYNCYLLSDTYFCTQVIFVAANGPVAWGIIAWGNSLVFHDLDKVLWMRGVFLPLLCSAASFTETTLLILLLPL
jgi:uncharacterized protein DUF2838